MPYYYFSMIVFFDCFVVKLRNESYFLLLKYCAY